jgi:hypothetical protein
MNDTIVAAAPSMWSSIASQLTIVFVVLIVGFIFLLLYRTETAIRLLFGIFRGIGMLLMGIGRGVYAIIAGISRMFRR